jgi:hypothetical protein
VTHFCIFGSCGCAWIPSEKRKALYPQSIECIFFEYPNVVKRYKLIDISSSQLIIKRSVQFEESVSHSPQHPHANTFILPPVIDDEHAHVESSSNESSDSKDSDDSNDSNVHSV